MLVPMVRIGEMRMAVGHGFMGVPVPVRRFGRNAGGVRMLMVFVMHVHVLVVNRLVRVRVLVAFRQMQPDAQSHCRGGQQQPRRDRLSQQRHRHRGPKEGRDREVGAGARCAQMTQAHHIECQAYAVGDKADRTRTQN